MPLFRLIMIFVDQSARKPEMMKPMTAPTKGPVYYSKDARVSFAIL